MSEPATPLPWFVPDKDQAAVWQGDIYPAKVASAKAYHAADAIADAAYIVEACNAYPELKAENERLQVNKLNKITGRCIECGDFCGLQRGCVVKALCAENERLRAALQNAEKMARLACEYHDDWYVRGNSCDGGQIAYDLKSYAANIAQEADKALNPTPHESH